MEIGKYLSVARRWWWLMILFALIGAVIGYTLAKKQPIIYTASTTLVVGPTIQSRQLTAGDIVFSQQLATTYADWARRQPVLQNVVDSLNLSYNWQALKAKMWASPIRGTQLIAIGASSTSREEARMLADEIANQLILLSPTAVQSQEQTENQRFLQQQIDDLRAKIEAGQAELEELQAATDAPLSAQQLQKLEEEIASLQGLLSGWEANYTQLLIFVEGGNKSPNYVAVIEPAQVGANFPPIRQNTIMGAIAGLVMSVGLVFAVEFLDDRFKTMDDVSQITGLVVLGAVNRVQGESYQDKLITSQGPFSPITETYRMVRANIQFMSIDEPIKSVMVTSPTPGDGKSITVANLGVIMAQAGFRTVIVDSDLRRPVQHQIFELAEPQLGLTDLLRAPELEPENRLKDTCVENLQVLTSGMLPPNPAELLGSQRMTQLVVSLNELADFLIFDSPPALVADPIILSNRVDGVLLVLRAGKTRRKTTKQTISNMQQAGADVLGAIFNGTSRKSGNYYYYQQVYSPNGQGPVNLPVQTIQRQLRERLPFLRK